MPVNEITQALGSWSITLRQDTPRGVLEKITYFGHVAIHAARQFHPETIGDSLLRSARYVGVVRAREFTGSQGGAAGSSSVAGASAGAGAGGSIPDSNLFGGSGMAYWLGDEDDKGSVIEGPGIALRDVSFTGGVRALLPASGAVTEGTLYSVTGSFTGGYVYISPRKAIADFCSYFNNSLGECEWRVNGDATLDAGTIDQLYQTTPRAIIARKSGGQDLFLRGLSGDAQTDEDVQDFSTRVLVLAEGTGDAVAVGAADINPDLNPYLDLHGNPVRLTRMVSQSGTDSSNADASAVLQLNRFLQPRHSIALSSDEMDLRGTFAVGDYIWAYDPDSGLIDTTHEAVFRGQRIYPVAIRVAELSWPVIAGMGVAYRDQAGNWTDLTDYVVWEDPTNVDLIVGGVSRTLSDSFSGEAVGSRPKPDSSIPGKVVWLLPFGLSSYQSATGITRSQVALAWHRPGNTDGTSILDGDHYEIRWRTSSHQILPITWGYAYSGAFKWVDLVRWNGLLPSVEGPWQYTAVGFDTTEFLLSDLTPGVPYDIEVRAVDNATPPNYGEFSDTETFETQSDPYPPSEPAPPEVASSLIAVQVTHNLGKSSGGTFNLEADLHHLEVHAAYEPTFTPDDSSRLGRLLATQGTLLSNTPVVGTFQIAITAGVWIKVVAVDDAGNRSGASGATQSSAQLIDDQHISDLSVSKVTAGTITSDWVVGADIATALAGVRAGMNAFGFYAFDPAGNQTYLVDAATGSVYMVGVLDTAQGGSRVRIAPSDDTHILDAPGIYMWAKDAANPALIYSVPEGADPTMIPSSIAITSSHDPTNNRVGTMYVRDNRAYLGMRTYVNPDINNPHGSYLENGSYFAALADRSEMAMVGQVVSGDIDYDGGFVSVSRTFAYFGFENATVPQCFWAWDSTGAMQMKGKYAAKVTDPHIGMFMGNFTPTGSGGGVSVSYGNTLVDPRLIVAQSISPSTIVSTQISTSTSTSFGIGYNPAGTWTVCAISYGVDH